MKRALIAALFATLAGGSAVQAQTVETDIAYGPRERNRLDLYLPADATAAPVVLFIHGGRWFRNGKDQIQLYDRVTLLNQAGIAVASMDHTYSSEATWPAQKEDVAAALNFLSDAGAGLGVDPSRLAVWGQSSGAHLALWAGILAAEGEAPAIAAVVAWYAPSNLYELAGDRLADEVPGGNERFPEPTPESLLLGVPVPENKAAADAASPERRIADLPEAASYPPLLLMHGDADFVVSPLQSRRLYETLKARNPEAEVTFRLVDGGEHGGEAFGPVVPEVVTFLKAHLENRSGQ